LNFRRKKEIFNSLKKLTIVPVSDWLDGKVKMSFLAGYKSHVIKNGIDLKVFHPRNFRDKIEQRFELNDKYVILGVASTWERRKGLSEFIKLSELLDCNNFVIILIGLTPTQKKEVSGKIIGIERTESVDELAEFYSAADVFLNPTLEDTYPTTNLESIACGTPVITYRTGGSVESVTEDTGLIVDKGDLYGLVNAIDIIRSRGKQFYYDRCIEHAKKNFNCENKFEQYLRLYSQILSQSNG
jgi:glycosyltransferase involved in cell wall biosynthesis